MKRRVKTSCILAYAILAIVSLASAAADAQNPIACLVGQRVCQDACGDADRSCVRRCYEESQECINRRPSDSSSSRFEEDSGGDDDEYSEGVMSRPDR